MSSTNENRGAVHRYPLPGVPTPLLDSDIANKAYVDTVGGAGFFANIVKPIDTTRQSTTTLVMDPHLVVTLPIGVYHIVGYLHLNGSVANDFKYTALIGTATATGVFSQAEFSGFNPSATQALDTAQGFACTGNEQFIVTSITITVTVAGTFGIGWSQLSSGATDCILRAGSSLEVSQA